jgi:hypothetical protein
MPPSMAEEKFKLGHYRRLKSALLKLQEVVSVCRWCGNRPDLPEPIDPTPATQIAKEWRNP